MLLLVKQCRCEMSVEDHDIYLLTPIAQTVDDEPCRHFVAVGQVGPKYLDPVIFVDRTMRACMFDRLRGALEP